MNDLVYLMCNLMLNWRHENKGNELGVLETVNLDNVIPNNESITNEGSSYYHINEE